MEFSKGEEVVFIGDNVTKTYYNITIGKAYEVIFMDIFEICILCDDNCLRWEYTYCFVNKRFYILNKYLNEKQ